MWPVTTDAQDTSTEAGPDSTSAWAAADRELLKRLMADHRPTTRKRRWWRRKPLPWLVWHQHQRHNQLFCQHRFERVAEWCANRQERRYKGQVGVHYTVRHRTDIRETEAGR